MVRQKTLLLFAVFLFFLPIYFNPEQRNSFGEIPKLFLASVFALGLLAWFAALKLKVQKFSFRWNTGMSLVSLLLIVNVVSFLFSNEKYLAFWGEPALPAEGLWSVVVFYILSFLILQFTEDEKDSNVLVKALLASLLFQTVFGILQKFDIAPFEISQLKQVTGTIGVTVAYATYLGCLLPFLVIKTLKQSSKIKSVLLSLVCGLVFVAISYTSSRTPLAVAVALLLGILSLYLITNIRKKFYFQIAGLVLIFLGAMLFIKLDGSSTEISSKFTTGGISHSVNHRMIIWKAGLEAWKQHPLLGTGPETFLVAERPFQSAAMNDFVYWNEGWPKAHNHLVQTLVCLGLVGALVVIFILLKLTLDSIRLFKKSGAESEPLGFYFGYLFLFLANLTCFNFVPTQLFTMLFPVLFYSAGGKNRLVNLPVSKFLFRFLQLAVLAVVAFSAFEIVSYYRSNKLIAAADYLHGKEHDYKAAADLALQAYAITPDNPGASCQVSLSLSSLLAGNIDISKKLSELKNASAGQVAQDANKIKSQVSLTYEQKKLALDEIHDFLEICESTSGGRLFFKLMRATSKALLYSESLAGLDDVIKEYKEASDLYPANPQPYLNMAIAYRLAKREDDYVRAIERAVSLKPDYMMAYLSLLEFYYEKKDKLQVDNTVKRMTSIEFKNRQFIPYIPMAVSVAESEGDTANATKLKQAFNFQLDRINRGELKF